MRVNDIRQQLKDLYAAGDFVVDKSGVRTVEILSASFIADEDTIFGKPNEDYIRREIDWYNTRSRNVHDMEEPIPEIWYQISGSNGYVNSNYGWCIYHQNNCHQYDQVMLELKLNPNSRRAVMIYTRPSMWHEYRKFNSNDFICTNAVQYLIRNGKLDVVVQMRSNDAVYGYKNDYAWQKHVQEKLAADLRVEPGTIYWQVGSLHVYERHFKLLEGV